ncbi:MAG: hypothetical protein R8M45_10755 [Ghiorsea sp.]
MILRKDLTELNLTKFILAKYPDMTDPEIVSVAITEGVRQGVTLTELATDFGIEVHQ